MKSLHTMLNHLKPITIEHLNPASICEHSDQFKERIRRLHQLADLNPHLVSREIEAAYRWQMNANKELATIEANWEKIPLSVLDQFGFTAKPIKDCLRLLYNPLARGLFIEAMKQHNRQSLPIGFGASNAPPSYHANRGIVSASKANKAQRTTAKPLYVQTRF